MSDAMTMCNIIIGLRTYRVSCWEIPHLYSGDNEVPELSPILGSPDCESCCPPFIVSLGETQTGREWFLWRLTSERVDVEGIFTWTLKDHHQEWGLAHGVNLEVILLGMDPHSEVANEFGCSSVALSRNDKPFLTYKRRKCDKPSSARCCSTTLGLLCVVCMCILVEIGAQKFSLHGVLIWFPLHSAVWCGSIGVQMAYSTPCIWFERFCVSLKKIN